ncbi:hypothetical protein [Natrononativus amylolyticus]|uniref:hypothetical protein n=1 Tax=Natrononativus amylolyticus TaxID=2963434 RepID=UPI0020CF75C8|nr:hypothetical protein [Natrononativus amylolyticus]
MEADLVEYELSGTTLYVSDVGGTSISFDLTGWDRLSDPLPFDEPIDTRVVGRLSKLRYDLENVVTVRRLDGDIPTPDGTGSRTSHEIVTESDTTLSLPGGSYFLQIESDILVRVRFDGEATIRNQATGSLSISFPHPTAVTFGFTTTMGYPRHELTIEPTTGSFATALSHLPATIRTTSPDRVHRPYRGHPPLLEIGSETAIPDAVREQRTDTGIEFVVPDRWESLFTVAPLAYYLGATVRTADGADSTPLLRAPAVDFAHEFSNLPAFRAETTAFLARTFFFDMLACCFGPDDPTLLEHDRLEADGIDLTDCADASIAERVLTYHELPSSLVDELVPEWPYRMTVPPSPEYAPTVPHLLCDLAVIDAATGRNETNGTDRGASAQTQGGALATLGRTKPIRGAVGTPGVDSQFSALPAAYANRLTYLEREREAVSAAVVFAGQASDADRTRIVDSYRRRGRRLSLTVDRYDDPSRDELADLLENGVELLHYVGDSDGTGLVCADGVLEPESLTRSRTQLAQLDAPNTHDVGAELVELGSVATVSRGDAYRSAASDDAVTGTTGTTIGELVLYGQSLATAHALEAICADSGVYEQGDSRVIGDGTHRFLSKWRPSHICVLTPKDRGVRSTILSFPVDPVGSHWVPVWHPEKRLMPATIRFDVEPDELAEYVSSSTVPIFYDGTLYWMEDHGRLLYPVT